MKVELHQQGRASVDFLADLGMWSGGLGPTINELMASRGLVDDGLAEDLDERIAQVDAAMADSPTYFAWSEMGEFLSRRHGVAAHEAFAEIKPEIQSELDRLEAGPTQIERADEDPTPDYAKGVDFHRTTGGWDGHPYQGFVHGEIIHRKYVAKNYPGDIFDQRRMVLGQLPRQDYKRIFEMGTSSGHFTVPLQETFPDAQITGCDMSATMMEQAQRAANERGWTWRLLQVPAEDTGLESESFDLVASFILLHEMPASAIRAIFEEAYRLLEPGGDMLMSDVRPFRDMDRLTEWRAYYVAVNGGEPHWLEAATIDLARTAEEVGFVNAKSGPAIEELRYPWVTVAHKPE